MSHNSAQGSASDFKLGFQSARAPKKRVSNSQPPQGPGTGSTGHSDTKVGYLLNQGRTPIYEVKMSWNTGISQGPGITRIYHR